MIRPEFCQTRGYCNSSRGKVIVSEARSFSLFLSFFLLFVLPHVAPLCPWPFVSPSVCLSAARSCRDWDAFASGAGVVPRFKDLFEIEGVKGFLTKPRFLLCPRTYQGHGILFCNPSRAAPEACGSSNASTFSVFWSFILLPPLKRFHAVT